MKLFDYLNSINYTKSDIMVDSVAEKVYNAYIINHSLSYFNDTVLLANEMNVNHHLDSHPQFSFLINTVRKRKRFCKWDKLLKSDDLEAVKSYYGYSNEKARQALTLLDNNQLDELKKRMYKGGKSK
jgi:hypothetical protein